MDSTVLLPHKLNSVAYALQCTCFLSSSHSSQRDRCHRQTHPARFHSYTAHRCDAAYDRSRYRWQTYNSSHSLPSSTYPANHYITMTQSQGTKNSSKTLTNKWLTLLRPNTYCSNSSLSFFSFTNCTFFTLLQQSHNQWYFSFNKTTGNGGSKHNDTSKQDFMLYLDD